MADLLCLFGNDEEEVNINDKCFIQEKKVKCNERPSTLRISRTEINFNENSGVRLTNGFKYSTSPVKVHQNFIFQKLRTMSCISLPLEMPPENPKGNIEYKRQLINLTVLRTNHLTTQLKWRLREGGGEAIYMIGVDDNGKILGLEISDLVESVCNLCRMAESLNAEVTVLREKVVDNRRAVEMLVRTLPSNCVAHETRITLLGNTDSGKSTLVGVLTQGIKDNGHGKTREATFRHKHEVESGRTSSISNQILGFDQNGQITNFYWKKGLLHQVGYEEVVLTSSRLVSLIDSAGFPKYQRTTFFALTAKRPHVVLLLLPSTHGIRETCVDHFRLCIALKLPVAVIITKVDIATYDNTLAELRRLFHDLNQSTVIGKSTVVKYEMKFIKSISQAKEAGKNLINEFTALSTKYNEDYHEVYWTEIPVFSVSCVTGKNLEILTTFLANIDITDSTSNCSRIIPSNDYSSKLTSPSDAYSEVWIDQTIYNVPHVDGCVVGGLVHEGVINEKDTLYLGPQKDGSFSAVSVLSIHRNRLNQRHVSKGQYVSLAVTTKVEIPSQDNCRNKTAKPETLNCSEICKGMILTNRLLTKTKLNFGIGLCLNRNKGRLVWGVVLSKVSIFNSNHSLINSPQEVARRGGESWILHCGNVCQKVKLISNSSDLKAIFGGKENKSSSLMLVFQFCKFPQWIHPNFPVVFHRSSGQQRIKGHGSVFAVLGNYMFRRLDKTHYPKRSKSKHLTINQNNSNNKTTTNFYIDSDEYYSAPSS